MFKSTYTIRMHDTDMAKIIFFASLFRIVHTAWEDLMEKEGLSYQHLFSNSDFAFVMVHAEADYKLPLTVGDQVEIFVHLDRIGTSSFTISYEVFKIDGHILAGTAKTVFATVNPTTRCKMTLPNELKKFLKKVAHDTK